MSLVGKVGRKRPRARLAMGILYAILCLGALTTLYPFTLMVGTGFKGPTDQNDNRVIPAYWQDAGELEKKYIDDKYAGDAAAIASSRLGASASAEEVERYRTYLSELPLTHWSAGFKTAPNQATGRLQIRYQAWLRDRFKNSIDRLNKTYIEENVAFQTVVPPAEMLERKSWSQPNTPKYRDWILFKAALPVEFRIPVREQKLWQEYVRGRTENQWERVPAALRQNATTIETLALPPAADAWYDEFRRTVLPARYRYETPEDRWAQYAARGVPMPIAADETSLVASTAAPIRQEFTFRNYNYVLDYILINGGAVWNTFLFCFLAIVTQLTVNPLAAYALSRYPVKQSGQILIFLLATMAFPAEVAMIPSFLLLKDLGLLNTFAALVLPAAASGYMIFLLKGFFDSLPQELFEAGQIDGAKETTMMMRIALPLSRPVLGYLALLAFMGAYGAFIYAFLIAQDQKMWTLMVWVYQLQASAPKSVIMAALSLVALPTLLVFLAAQRVIMRGIVLPGER